MSPKMWFRLLGLSCLLIVAGFAVPALTQGAKKGKKYALLVGVTKYDSKNFSNLNFTANDAEEMARAMTKAGFASVRVLTSERGAKDEKAMPTTANIRSALKEILAKKTRHDTVLIGLAGHGIQLEVTDKAGNNPKTYSYFCPKDASLQGISHSTGRSNQLMLLDDLFADLGKSDAGHRLALIDACRNDGKVQTAKRRIDPKAATIPDGVGVLFSCGRGQFAFETKALGKGHGLFFYHVIQGLSGDAADKEGVVTWDGLSAYVKRQVPRAAKKIGDGASQTPASMGNLEGESVLARIDADGARFTNSIGMKLVLVKKGKFKMGSPKTEKDRGTDEDEHEVEITKDFYLGAYEVTQGQFREVMGFNPSYFSRDGKGDGSKYEYAQPGGGKDKVKGFTQKELDEFPVENVSWEDAQAFLKKLNARPAEKAKGRVSRLPTEAEWEYAARGGASSKKYHTGDSISTDDANFDKKLGRTAKVGSYAANKFGLHDMHGNVYEWCADWYDEKYYANSPARAPLNLKEGSDRVFRGGNWVDTARRCRSANRSGGHPGYRNDYLGFRVALVPAK